jgi:hypothetical protein
MPRAPDQQGLVVRCNHEQQRPQSKTRNAAHVDGPPPVAVRSLCEQGRADELGEDVHVEEPGEAAIVQAKLLLDRGQRGADDGKVQRTHQHADEEQRHHGPEIVLQRRAVCCTFCQAAEGAL